MSEKYINQVYTCHSHTLKSKSFKNNLLFYKKKKGTNINLANGLESGMASAKTVFTSETNSIYHELHSPSNSGVVQGLRRIFKLAFEPKMYNGKKINWSRFEKKIVISWNYF